MKIAPKFATERVPVVFLPFRGKGGVRQLFSDLNLNAKPVSKTIGYAYESRDPVVIITKRVMQEVPLLVGRVNQRSNSLSPRSADVVTVNTLVASHIEVLSAIHGVSAKMTELHKVPSIKAVANMPIGSPEVEELAQPLITFWETFVTHTPGWADLMADKPKTTAGALRDGSDTAKGHVSAYGIGWQAVAIAYAALIRFGFSEDPLAMLAQCLNGVNWQKGSHWNGIAMVGMRVNNTGPGIRATAGYILSEGNIPEPVDEDDRIIRPLFESYRRSVEQAQEAA